jgi:hypothetical protein
MKRFKIACSWEVCGEIYIEADSLEEAMKKAEESEDIPSPFDSEYIDGSFKVNKQVSLILNGVEQ